MYLHCTFDIAEAEQTMFCSSLKKIKGILFEIYGSTNYQFQLLIYTAPESICTHLKNIKMGPAIKEGGQSHTHGQQNLFI